MTKKHHPSIEGIYGEMPKRPEHLSVKTESCDPNFATEKPFFNSEYEEEITDVTNQFSKSSLFYYARGGGEYLSRDDWNKYLYYIDSKIENRGKK